MKQLLFVFLFLINTSYAQDNSQSNNLFGTINQIAKEFNNKYLSTLTREQLEDRRNSVTRVRGYFFDGEVHFKKDKVDMDKNARKDYHYSDTGEVGAVPFQVEFGTEGIVVSAAAFGGYNMLNEERGKGINNISYMKVNYLNSPGLDVVNLKFFEFEALPTDFLAEKKTQRFGPVVDLSMGHNWLMFKEKNGNLNTMNEALRAYKDGFSLASGVGLSYGLAKEKSNFKGEVKYKLYNYVGDHSFDYFNGESRSQQDLNFKMSFSKKLKARGSLNFFVESNFFLNGDRHIQELLSPQSVNLPRQRLGLQLNF